MDNRFSVACFESIPAFSEKLDSIFKSCTSDLGEIMNASLLLCGLFSLIYVGNIVWQSWCKGDSINIYALFRPLAIGFVIANFTHFVVVLDTMCGWVSIPTQNLIHQCATSGNDKVQSAISTSKSLMGNDKKGNKDNSSNGVVLNGEGGSYVMDSYRDEEQKGEESSWKDALADKIVEGIMDGIEGILSVISLVLAIGILLVAFVSKLILIYLGPFAFALSLIPYFSRSISNWIGRYVTVSLYVPCINIICYAMMRIRQVAVDPKVMGEDAGFLYFLILSVASGLAFLSVPSLTNYVVESSGAGGMTGESRSAGQKMAKMAGRQAISAISSAKGFIANKLKK